MSDSRTCVNRVRCEGSGQRPVRTAYQGGGLWRCGHCGLHVSLTMLGKFWAHKRDARQ